MRERSEVSRTSKAHSTNDDGSSATTDYDQGNANAWSTIHYKSDPQNRLDYITIKNDDGSSATTDYDQANTNWTYLNYNYDAQGQLLYTFVQYDSGSTLVL